MARIYTPADRLIDVLDFLDANANPCQEAKDYCRSLGDITMGEFMDIIEDNPDDFWPNWLAYSVVSFPKLMNAALMNRFEAEANKHPSAMKSIAHARSRPYKAAKELRDNG